MVSVINAGTEKKRKGNEKEYLREAFYKEPCAIFDDVILQQEKINAADCIVFVFPNFWTAAPAILEGWFQRVWTYGYAYGNKKMKVLDKAVFLMTMGGNKNEHSNIWHEKM